MIIEHPLLGPRDASEFTYMGDAALIHRPDWTATTAVQDFADYGYLRDNPAGRHRELWFHEGGDRSWLVVTRDTTTHAITSVELARDVARRRRTFEMTQSNRLDGGLINRDRPINFTFDNIPYQGFEGDTLASALLANNVRLMGRSFKYHRPRGPLTAGSEEPNAIVELRDGARKEPNTRATTAELFEGLTAKSQNRWPSLAFDMMAINDRLSSFLAAGFYYKTFMWPAAFWEKLYEPIIRRAAGLGSAALEPDPDTYDKGFLHCDLLITGAGPTGLMAALTAGRAGAQVILADEDSLVGGRLNCETITVNDQAGSDWVRAVQAELADMPNVRIMTTDNSHRRL